MITTGTHYRCDGHNRPGHAVLAIPTVPLLIGEQLVTLCDHCLADFRESVPARVYDRARAAGEDPPPPQQSQPFHTGVPSCPPA